MKRKSEAALSRRIKVRLLEEIREFHRWNERVQRVPAAGAVHHLRVSLRKLQAAQWLLEEEPSLAKFAKLSRRLKKHLRALGKIREFDVSAAILREHDLSAHALRWLRAEEERKLSRRYTTRRDAKLSALLDSFGAAVARLPEIDVRPAVRRLEKEMSSLINYRATSYGDLHRLRIRLKRIRYALRFLDRDDDNLRALQELLGRLHDYQSIPKKLRSGKIRRERDQAREESIRATPRRLKAAAEHLDLL